MQSVICLIFGSAIGWRKFIPESWGVCFGFWVGFFSCFECRGSLQDFVAVPEFVWDEFYLVCVCLMKTDGQV